MNPWQTTKPPHNEIVEVKNGNEIIRVKAIWGDRDRGILPHWESEDDGILYSPDYFSEWRKIKS